MNQLKAGTRNGMLLAAKELVPSTEIQHGWVRDPAGIRAQLVHRGSGKLVDDFVIEQGRNSTHILNAVSPGWTSAFPFAQHIIDKFISRDFGIV
jgi:L-2-hydroxyglutarate oxidase LhgO